MDIITRSKGELCEKLRQITLRGGGVQPYLNAYISIETVNPKILAPCQRYVLLDELRKIEKLRWNIEHETGQDILRLNGYVKCVYDEGHEIDIIPVVVEEFFTPFGELKLIINDGMHRAFLAYQMGVPINIAYVRGAHSGYPYYAYSLPRGFEEVEIITSLPEGYLKKFHTAKDHKSLYRNFNSTFTNIGDSRPYTKES